MTKYSLLFILAIAFISCNDGTPKDYVKFSGKITNSHGNEVSIRGEDYTKKIKMNDDGTFSDTLLLKSEGAFFTFSDGNEQTQLYLKNGDNIKLTLDTKEFDETVIFKGKGAESNNYLAQKMLLQEELFTDDLFDLDEKVFDEKTTSIKNKFLDFLAKSKGIDSILAVKEKEEIGALDKMLKGQYERINERKMKFAAFKGKKSPAFTDYENDKGGTTSLKDLKGKFVYIDVWATWCGPCKAEIPHLKTLEKEFHGKNIEFVSISVDKENKHEAWKKMIVDKEMGGIQLFAGKDNSFSKEFEINSIPRFILIDPNGNVIDADASRPSDSITKEMLTNLLNN